MSGESFCLFSGFASWVGGKVLILKLCAAHTVLWAWLGLEMDWIHVIYQVIYSNACALSFTRDCPTRKALTKET